MAKRPDPRRLRWSITYTVQELASVLGVTEATVRAWIKGGLPALSDKRPTLIIGAAAKDFLANRRKSRRRPLAPNELYCMSCKAPRKAYGGMVDLLDTPGKPLRIHALCSTCETACSRVISRDRIVELPLIFDVEISKAGAA